MKVYLCGPVRDDVGLDTYIDAETVLFRAGYTVVNACTALAFKDPRERIRKSLLLLLEAELLCWLSGAVRNPLAAVELQVAQALGLRVVEYDELRRRVARSD